MLVASASHFVTACACSLVRFWMMASVSSVALTLPASMRARIVGIMGVAFFPQVDSLSPGPSLRVGNLRLPRAPCPSLMALCTVGAGPSFGTRPRSGQPPLTPDPAGKGERERITKRELHPPLPCLRYRLRDPPAGDLGYSVTIPCPLVIPADFLAGWAETHGASLRGGTRHPASAEVHDSGVRAMIRPCARAGAIFRVTTSADSQLRTNPGDAWRRPGVLPFEGLF